MSVAYFSSNDPILYEPQCLFTETSLGSFEGAKIRRHLIVGGLRERCLFNLRWLWKLPSRRRFPTSGSLGPCSVDGPVMVCRVKAAVAANEVDIGRVAVVPATAYVSSSAVSLPGITL